MEAKGGLSWPPSWTPTAVVVLRFDSGDELVVNSMKARRQYLELLA
jgi:hypothetical protein